MAVRFVTCIAHRRGLFENRVMEFGRGLNVVYGGNGSGKSLLVRAMIDAVWGVPSGQPLLGDEAWDSLFIDIGFFLERGGRYRSFNIGDGSFRVEHERDGVVTPVFDARGGHGAGESVPGDDYRAFMEAMDRNALVHSSFIPSAADVGAVPLMDYGAVRGLLMEDASGMFRTHLNLRGTFSDGEPRDEETPGEVLRFQEKMRDLEKKIQIMDISGARHDKLRRERETIRREMDDLNCSIASLKSQKDILVKIIENLNRVEGLKKEFDAITDEIQSEQRKIESMAEMKTEIDTLYPQFSDIDIEDGTTLDRLQEVFNGIRNHNQKIDDYHLRRDSRIRRATRAAVAAGACGVAGVTAVMARNAFDPSRDVILWGGIALVLLLAAASLVIYRALVKRDRELAILEEEKGRYKARITALMEKSRLELEDYKLTEIYELLLQYFEDYVNYTERKKDLDRIRSSLKEEEYMVRIQNKLDALKREEAIITREIHTSIDTLDIVDDIENETSRIGELMRNIDTEVAILKEKVETKDRILDRIEGEIQRASGAEGSVGGIMEEMDGIERILRKWKVNRKSLEFIDGVLDEAVRRTEERQTARLVEGALERFGHLTGDRYRERIGHDEVRAVLCGGATPAECTPPLAHALVLSLKLALSDFIDGEDAAPLLIDEPFQFMDDERCGRLRDLVARAALKRQVIIFTHQGDKRSWGDFIEL